MPNKELKQTIAMLEGLKRTTGLTDLQSKQLRWAKLRLRFFWLPQVTLHAFFILVVVLSYRHLKHLDHIGEIHSAADRLDLALSKAESSQRGFLLTGKLIYLADYNYYATTAHRRMEDLCLLIPASEYNDKLCHSLERSIVEKLEEMQTTVVLAKAGGYEQALTIVRTDRGFDLSRNIFKAVGSIRLEAQDGYVRHQQSCLAQ